MEKPDASEPECVVCPVFVKKVQKKMAHRKVAEQKKNGGVHAQQLKFKAENRVNTKGRIAEGTRRRTGIPSRGPGNKENCNRLRRRGTKNHGRKNHGQNQESHRTSYIIRE